MSDTPKPVVLNMLRKYTHTHTLYIYTYEYTYIHTYNIHMRKTVLQFCKVL